MKDRKELVKQAETYCGDIVLHLNDAELIMVQEACRQLEDNHSYVKLMRYLDSVAFDRQKKINRIVHKLMIDG